MDPMIACPVCSRPLLLVDRHDDPEHPCGVCHDCCLDCNRHPVRVGPGEWQLGRFTITHEPLHEIPALTVVDGWLAVSRDDECVFGSRRQVLAAIRERGAA